MNLYLISQDQNDDWDTYSGAVVATTNDLAARLIHPDGKSRWNGMFWTRNREGEKEFEDKPNTWASPLFVTSKKIGLATDSVELNSVICASFHAD